MKSYVDPSDLDVIAPNLKRRLSGVTSTIVQLIPALQSKGLAIATLGPGLPDELPSIRFRDLWRLWLRPHHATFRIWHARRNVEMIVGLVLCRVLRMPLKLVFTSAAQRHHKSFTKWLIRRMDKVIATSSRSGSFLEVSCEVIRHGIDTDVFSPFVSENTERPLTDLPGKYLVGCAGRIRHQKGTDLFVDAMISLLPQFPVWTAVVAGRTTREHEAFLRRQIEKIEAAGLQRRIVFVGEVEDIKPLYRRFSLFVAPSRNEGFGLTPLEAMACETAVVTSDAGAYAELVGKGAGTVVPAGDLEQLTRAVGRYLADPDLSERSGIAARAHVLANFKLDNEANALLRVYRAVLD